MSSKKLMIVAVSAVLAIIMLFMPIIAAASVVAAPVVLISNFFSGIGDFLFGDNDETLELVETFKISLTYEEVQRSIHETYGVAINSETDIEVPLNYLVVAQFLSGVESKEIDDEILQSMIEATKESYQVTEIVENKEVSVTKYRVVDELTFAQNIKQVEPFKTKFNDIRSEVLQSYILVIPNVYYFSGLPGDFLLNAGDFIYPLNQKANVTAEFGFYDPFETGTLTQHNGIDLAYETKEQTCGQPVYSSITGIVTERNTAYKNDERGYYIVIENDTYKTRYLHFQSASPLDVGTEVKQGDFIGVIGTTGRSTGCHLHFETYIKGSVVNPRTVIDFDSPKTLTKQTEKGD